MRATCRPGIWSMACGRDVAGGRLRPQTARGRGHTGAGVGASDDRPDAARANMSISGDGTLVYVRRAGCRRRRRRAHWCGWIGRDARSRSRRRRGSTRTRGSRPMARGWRSTSREQETDIWIWDLARETLTRFTFDPAARYVIRSGRRTGSGWCSVPQRRGPFNLFWQAADGTGAVERLTESPNNQIA